MIVKFAPVFSRHPNPTLANSKAQRQTPFHSGVLHANEWVCPATAFLHMPQVETSS
jgi:hypothetical protein